MEGVQIIVSTKVFGMEFTTKHHRDYYKNQNKENEEFAGIMEMEKEIKSISLCDEAVYLILEE